jgi:hypothetical protein
VRSGRPGLSFGRPGPLDANGEVPIDGRDRHERRRLYVTGGQGQNAQMMSTVRALEAYDPVVNTRTILPSMGVARHGLAGAVIGDRLHMVHGK